MKLDPAVLAEYNASRQSTSKAVLCHAPFTSINFAPTGNASVCCYSRRYILGTYPHDSVEDIWFGAKAQQLRRLVKPDALPPACDLCLEQLQTRNFGGLRARFFDYLASPSYPEVGGHLTSYPRVLEFETSNVCNLECTMCNGTFSSSIRSHREHLPPLRNPYDAAFVRQLEPFIPHLTAARFLGGEPFLITLYYHIWEVIARRNPKVEVTIVTNGTILNQRVRNIVERLTPHINISIDSLNRHNYERIRLNASFDRVMEHFRYFRQLVHAKKTTMTINVCPMQQNWHELPALVHFCNTHGVNVFFNTVSNPETASLRYLPRAHLTNVHGFLRAARLPESTAIERTNKANYVGLVNQIAAFCSNAVAGDHDTFQAADISQYGWSLHLAGDNVATLRAASVEAPVLQIKIASAGTPHPWDVQLYKTGVLIESNHHYVLAFRARALEPRTLVYGVVNADAPWHTLGRYRSVPLTRHWQTCDVQFGPLRWAARARLHFDLGGSSTCVELADVTLRRRAVNARPAAPA